MKFRTKKEQASLEAKTKRRKFDRTSEVSLSFDLIELEPAEGVSEIAKDLANVVIENCPGLRDHEIEIIQKGFMTVVDKYYS